MCQSYFVSIFRAVHQSRPSCHGVLDYPPLILRSMQASFISSSMANYINNDRITGAIAYRLPVQISSVDLRVRWSSLSAPMYVDSVLASQRDYGRWLRHKTPRLLCPRRKSVRRQHPQVHGEDVLALGHYVRRRRVFFNVLIFV